MMPSRLSTSRIRAKLPIRPDPERCPSDVPETFIAARSARGPRNRRTHQPWISRRLASIVLLKISAVRPNRNRTSSVNRRLVVTTAGSIPPGSGPPMSFTMAGT